MRLELHCHSLCSDGTDAPAEVVRKAAATGVTLFCLTDHDTWAGFDAAHAAAGPEMRCLRGTELTVELGAHAKRATAHLLLLGLRDGEALDRLDHVLQAQRDRRRQRIHDICARFTKWNIRLDPDAILAAAGDATPGRPHVAAALVKAGVCTSVREAFDRFLKDGGPADVTVPRVTIEDGVAMARAAGARVALAHPHLVGAPGTVRRLFERLKPAGLDGIEALYGSYQPRDRQGWLELADDLGLVATAGSDYHGTKVVPDIASPGMTVDEPRAAALVEWLASG